MKKVIIFVLFFIVSASVFPYKITDYEKFILPSDCNKCDLTQVEISPNISNLNFEYSFFTGSSGRHFIANNSNFRNANFVYASVQQGDFKNANFNHARLNNASFYSNSFVNASFVNAKMEHSNFFKSNFTNVDFTNANLKNANFSFANLSNSNITSAQLQSLQSYECATLPNGELFDDDGAINCYRLANTIHKNLDNKVPKPKNLLQFSSPTDLDHFIKTKECTNCDLSNHDFCYDYYESELKNSSISSSDLRNSYFMTCDFSTSSIVNSIIFSSEFNAGKFMRVDFEGSKFDYSTIYSGHFSESSFKNASLRKVNFQFSNLSSTNFTNANTQSVVFDRAILIGSNINQEQLNKAKSITCSVLPNGDVAPSDDGFDCPNQF